NRLSSTNTSSDQDDLVILATGVSVRGGRFGEEGTTYTGIAGNQARYGATIGAEVAAYALTDTILDGVTDGAQIPATNSTGSRRRIVTRNRRGTTGSALGYATTA